MIISSYPSRCKIGVVLFLALGVALWFTACVVDTEAQSGAGGGFTPTSAVTELPSGDLYVGVEAVIPAGKLSKYEFPFEVPFGKRILGFEGSIAFRSGCHAQALTLIIFEGAGAYVKIQKLPEGGGADNEEFIRRTPIQTQSTEGRIHLEADPVSPCPGVTTVEIQGILEVEK